LIYQQKICEDKSMTAAADEAGAPGENLMTFTIMTFTIMASIS
jgi:hypothetical protein